MRISNSKRQLAQIIHENGGWHDDAEFYCQDGDGEIFPYENKPTLPSRGRVWHYGGVISDGSIMRETPIKNWHQTVLSRDEYFHLYPAPDAEAEQKAEIRWVRGKDIYATPTAHDCMEMLKEKWGSTECGCDECSAFYSKPAAHAESTIEQLAADYRNAKDFADRKQQEADAAKADAEAKLAELVAAGKALGFVPVSAVRPAIDGCMRLVDMVPTRLQIHQDESIAAIGYVVNVERLYDTVREAAELIKGDTNA